jgi:hypothetical protein
MAHRDPEDDHLWGKRLAEKGDTVRFGVLPKGAHEDLDSTQKMLQT